MKNEKMNNKMTAQVYENLKQLTYSELLNAISNIKDKLYNQGVDVDKADFQYYIALVQEMDARQRDT